MSRLLFTKPSFWIVPFSLIVSVLCCAQAPVPEPATDQETELGQEVYKELKAKGEIIESSPLYDTLKPLVESISRVAQSRYPHPRTTPQSLLNSILIRNQPFHSACQRMPPNSFCVRLRL